MMSTSDLPSAPGRRSRRVKPANAYFAPAFGQGGRSPPRSRTFVLSPWPRNADLSDIRLDVRERAPYSGPEKYKEIDRRKGESGASPAYSRKKTAAGTPITVCLVVMSIDAEVPDAYGLLGFKIAGRIVLRHQRRTASPSFPNTRTAPTRTKAAVRRRTHDPLPSAALRSLLFRAPGVQTAKGGCSAIRRRGEWEGVTRGVGCEPTPRPLGEEPSARRPGPRLSRRSGPSALPQVPWHEPVEPPAISSAVE
jgi:hypothetical protein